MIDCLFVFVLGMLACYDRRPHKHLASLSLIPTTYCPPSTFTQQVLPEPGGQVNNWFAASIFWLLRTFAAKGLEEVQAGHALLFKGK